MEQETVPSILLRYGPPNKFDIAPYLTRCKVTVSSFAKACEIYVQMSHDPENPRWELVDTI